MEICSCCSLRTYLVTICRFSFVQICKQNVSCSKRLWMNMCFLACCEVESLRTIDEIMKAHCPSPGWYGSFKCRGFTNVGMTVAMALFDECRSKSRLEKMSKMAYIHRKEKSTPSRQNCAISGTPQAWQGSASIWRRNHGTSFRSSQCHRLIIDIKLQIPGTPV